MSFPKRRLIMVSCLLSLTLAAGCALPSQAESGKWRFSGFAWSRNNGYGKGAKKLTDPEGLHLKYARLQEQQGQLTEARRSYELVLGNDPEAVDAILGLSRLDHLAGRAAEAEQGIRKAHSLKPNDPHVLSTCGQFYAGEKRWDEAVPLLNSAMLAAPDESAYRYQLAVALAHSGKVNEALPHFERTVGDAAAHYNVGYILYEQGKLEQADQQLQQALIKRPELAEAQAMLDEIRAKRDGQTLFAGSGGPAAQGKSAADAARTSPVQATGFEQSSRPRAAAGEKPQATPQQLEQWRNQSIQERTSGT